MSEHAAEHAANNGKQAVDVLVSLGSPGYRTTVVLLIDLMYRGDAYSLLGIVTYWLSVLIPAVSVNMTATQQQVANELLWVDMSVCLYCFARPLYHEPFNMFNLWLWVETSMLVASMLVMALTSVAMEVVTRLLLHGTVWGTSVAAWWYRVVAEIHREKAEFHANMAAHNTAAAAQH
jgi:hypothetical protein